MTCYRQRKLERWTRHTWLRPWRLVSWKTFQGWSKRWKVHTLRPLNYRFSDTTRKTLIKFISTFTVVCNSLQCYDTMFVGCQEGHPACKKIEWWGVGVFISLDSLKLGATASQNPIVSCFIWVQIAFTFLVPAYSDCPGKEAVIMVVVVLYHFLQCIWYGIYGAFNWHKLTHNCWLILKVTESHLLICLKICDS